MEEHRRAGFALALVVFLLFAIGVAAGTAYQVLMSEASMSLTDQQGSLALSAAHAGLERFVATETGPVPVERTYMIQDARAVVVPRRIWNGPFPDHTYLLTSEGTFIDPRFAGDAVERTVVQRAIHDRVPLELLGALVSPSGSVVLENVTEVEGYDTAAGGACPEAGAVDVAGVVAGGMVDPIGGTGVSGSPQVRSFPGPGAVLDSLGIAWDVLTDPSLPMDHENPNLVTLSTDPFSTIRFSGDLTVDCFDSGSGLLIVAGRLEIDNQGLGGALCELGGQVFTWDGLILAGSIASLTDESFLIEGSLVVGLDGSGDPFTIDIPATGVPDARLRFNSCSVIDASRGVAHFRPVEGTWWEIR